jgi:hypothetical protein
MTISNEERFKLFQEELNLIYDEGIREFTKLALTQLPAYFFLDCPSSSSSRFHPIDEHTYIGCIIHTKRVFTVAYELCRGLNAEGDRDEILAAAILHDGIKQGKVKTGHTVKNHPGLAADLIREVYDATQMISNKSYSIIRNCVGYHYGPWSISPWSKSLALYTPSELTLYISDYVASKRCVAVDYKR